MDFEGALPCGEDERGGAWQRMSRSNHKGTRGSSLPRGVGASAVGRTRASLGERREKARSRGPEARRPRRVGGTGIFAVCVCGFRADLT